MLIGVMHVFSKWENTYIIFGYMLSIRAVFHLDYAFYNYLCICFHGILVKPVSKIFSFSVC